MKKKYRKYFAVILSLISLGSAFFCDSFGLFDLSTLFSPQSFQFYFLSLGFSLFILLTGFIACKLFLPAKKKWRNAAYILGGGIFCLGILLFSLNLFFPRANELAFHSRAQGNCNFLFRAFVSLSPTKHFFNKLIPHLNENAQRIYAEEETFCRVVNFQKSLKEKKGNLCESIGLLSNFTCFENSLSKITVDQPFSASGYSLLLGVGMDSIMREKHTEENKLHRKLEKLEQIPYHLEMLHLALDMNNLHRRHEAPSDTNSRKDLETQISSLFSSELAKVQEALESSRSISSDPGSLANYKQEFHALELEMKQEKNL